ncbi:MAG: AsmA family protein [Halioglobus sp.]|nr:AsmA family protein [Halioglobus sp.]
MLRFIAIFLGLLLVLAIAAVLLLPVFVDKDQVVALAADAIRKETGIDLQVNGDLDLSFFPNIGVAFTEASLTMPEKTQPDIEIEAASIGVQLRPLLSGKVEVESIGIDGLLARLESTPEERVDTSGFSDAQLEAWYAEQRRKRKAAGQAAGAEAVLAVPLALTVSSLDVSNARIETTDTSTGATSVIELISLAVRDVNLDNRAIPLDVALRVPGEQPIDVSARGAVKVSQDTDSVQFSDLAVSVEGATAQPLQLTLTGAFDIARQAADTQVALELGDMRGQGKLRYASFESPQIDADLALNLFDPVLLALAGPEAAASAEDAPAANGDEALPLDALRAIDTRAALTIDTARFDAHEVTGLKVRLRAVEGLVDLRELTGTVHGGQLQARATLNGRLNTATLDTRGSVKSLDLASAMAASGAPDLVRGSAGLSWQLSGRGASSNALTRSLAGPIQLDTSDVVLLGTSVEKMLCQVVALTNNQQLTAGSFPADTQFTDISANVQLTDGVARLDPLRAEMANVKFTGDGSFDLLEQDFEADFRGRLSRTLEELDPACKVSKQLAAIDIPVACEGNLAGEPARWCGVNSEKIIRDLAVFEGKRKLEKKANKFLNKFLQQKNKDGE